MTIKSGLEVKEERELVFKNMNNLMDEWTHNGYLMEAYPCFMDYYEEVTGKKLRHY